MATEKKLLPWEVSWDEYKALEVEATPEILALAKKLAARLADKKPNGYGAKGAWLYRQWAEKKGRPAVAKWWAKQT